MNQKGKSLIVDDYFPLIPEIDNIMEVSPKT